MNSILEDIKQSFRQGSSLTRIIYINLAVFVLVNLIYSIAFLMSQERPNLIQWLAVPAHLPGLIIKPWTVITYMFLHQDFFHILFNLLWLYFLGRIFQDLMGDQRFISTYILGGISGAFLYILAYNVFPVFSNVLPVARAMGASASVLAIIVAVATKAPNYQIHLLFLGPVKLKYIAIVSVILDLISFQDGNAGGHIAHLGGAIYGFFYIKQLDSGRDWSVWFYKWVNTFKALFSFRKKSRIKVVHKKKNPKNYDPNGKQHTVDQILDKISKSGYDSLTTEEKNILFKASQNK